MSTDLAKEPMHSFLHKRNEEKIKETEKELEKLLGSETDSEQEEEPNSKSVEEPSVSDESDPKQKENKKAEAPKEDTANLTGEEKSFKKRYGDIQRHLASKEKEWTSRLETLENQLSKAAKNELVLPKSQDEIDAWAEKYPDIAGIVEAIADKKATERSSDLDKRLKEVEEMRNAAKKEKAEVELMNLHPDFESIRNDDAFHDWAEKQPKVYQDALYDNPDDVKSVARVIDMYKSDMGIKTKKPNADKAAAASVKARGRTIVDAEESSKTLSESMVKSMSLKEYEERQDEILDAMRSGKFVYDLKK